jgi:hypothetical protein
MKRFLSSSVVVLSTVLLGAPAAADEGALRDRTIGFVLTHKSFALWQSADGKTECPQGMNVGPREQFKALYPDDTPRKFAETQLEREGEIHFPDTTPEPALFFREPVGKIGVGLNLDGRVDDNDFQSQDGRVTGIDNQMYRVVGCTDNYRGPEGQARHFIQSYMQKFNYNRWIIELTDVDDLANDPEVKVAIYRGLDNLTQDAAGNFTSGGTQRVTTAGARNSSTGRPGRSKTASSPPRPSMSRSPNRSSADFPISRCGIGDCS